MRILWVCATLGALALSGCDDGRLDLQLTDAPYTDASSVLVTITGVELKSADKGWQRFEFATPLRVDLLALNGGKTQSLLSNESVPSGDYDAVRLLLRTADDSAADAYVRLRTGATLPLYVSDDSDDRLTLETGFSVDDVNNTALTLDVDLRRALLKPTDAKPDVYRLVSALRLVENDKTGTLSGTVSALGSGCVPAVYVYEGEVTPDDIGGSGAEPLTSTTVTSSGSGGSFTAAFLPAGRYTAALTCQADEDDPARNDSIDFSDSVRFDIDRRQTTTIRF